VAQQRHAYREIASGAAMVLFLAGFAAGAFVMVYLFLGADRASRSEYGNAAANHADKWRNQHPLPPV
jgi:hypothetical protein